MSHDRYELVVGLEVHVQLKTKTKIFCDCPTDFGAPPNANTCPVCLALPGALPVLNAHAVALAARGALALGCTINATSVFARKNYFYPDLPKGYQISQFDRPIAEHGAVVIGQGTEDTPRRIGITRVHMEEDAGKSIHDRFPAESAIDLNRSGVPLVEIVSEPEIRSSADAGAYLRELKRILEYVDVSDANMEEGSLRVDANVSARRHGDATLGTRTEIKNMNSFSGVERAIETEFARQCAALDRGESIHQQTMLWDGNRSEIRPARSKEGSHDYRYFPDPDLPPLELDVAWIAEQRLALPELPATKRARFVDAYALSANDAAVLTASRAIADYFEGVAKSAGDGKGAANWVMGEVLATLNNSQSTIDRFPVIPADLGELLSLVRSGVVSNSAAKKILAIMATSGEKARVVADREGLTQVGDDGALIGWIDEVWSENPDEAARFASGEPRLLGVLVGLVMKKSKGRADPKKVNQLLASRTSG